MGKREAEQFEAALNEMAAGRRAPGEPGSLLHTARQAATLAGPLPPPPRGLVPGRQRFLAEAARLRAEDRPARRRPGLVALRLSSALAALLLLLGLAWGLEQAAAASLPGQPLHALELALEAGRRALAGAAGRADLDRAAAAERLDEIAALLRRGQAVAAPAWERAAAQAELALESAAGQPDEAAGPALRRLEEAIRQREQALREATGGPIPAPLGELLGTLAHVREEAGAGQGDPDGLRQRLRLGAPSGSPQPSRTPDHTPGPSGTPQPSRTPGHTPGPSGTPQPSRTPGHTPGPSGTPQPSRTPDHTPGPGGSPTPGGGGKGP